MSRSAKKKHARKLKKAKNDRKALARLQGTLKIRNKEVDFSEGLVKESASKWGTDTAMDIGDGKQGFEFELLFCLPNLNKKIPNLDKICLSFELILSLTKIA